MTQQGENDFFIFYAFAFRINIVSTSMSPSDKVVMGHMLIRMMALLKRSSA